MMGWEQVTKASAGAQYGSGWSKYPAAAVTKTGISMNRLFADVFGMTSGKAIQVFIDSENRRIGLKACPEGDGLGFRVQDSGSRGTSVHVTVKRIPKLFADCVGRAYRAHLNPGEKIIEIELSTNNMVK